MKTMQSINKLLVLEKTFSSIEEKSLKRLSPSEIENLYDSYGFTGKNEGYK